MVILQNKSLISRWKPAPVWVVQCLGLSQPFRTLPAPPEGVPAPHLYSDTPNLCSLVLGCTRVEQWTTGSVRDGQIYFIFF